jgi:hypothetical protein
MHLDVFFPQPPKDTAQFGVPSSCANGACHVDQTVDWLQEAFERHYH